MHRQDSYEWDRLLTAQEVADIVRVHVGSFTRWCREGKGPAETRLGNVARYAESDVRRWIEARREPAASGAADRPEVA